MTGGLDSPLARILAEVAASEGRLLQDPRHLELDPAILEGVAEVHGRVETHATEMSLTPGQVEKLQVDHSKVKVGDVSLKKGAKGPSTIPKGIQSRIEELAIECEYLLLEEERLTALTPAEVKSVLEAFQKVKDRIPPILTELEPLQDNVFCRLMYRALQKGMDNLQKLELMNGPRAECIRLQEEMRALIEGEWPLYDVKAFEATGLKFNDDDPRVPKFAALLKNIMALEAASGTAHPDHNHFVQIHEVHSNMLMVNAACSRLNDEFIADGGEDDEVEKALFEEEVLASFREFGMAYMDYLDLHFGTDPTVLPTAEDLQKAEEANDRIMELMLEKAALLGI